MSYSQETFTEKAFKAIQESEFIARTHRNIQLQPLHLALALAKDPEGLFKSLAQKCSVDSGKLEALLNKGFGKLPRQEPAPEVLNPSRGFISILSKAQNLQKANSDSHIAVDHLILALLDEKELVPLFEEAGLTKTAVENAVKAMRGSSKVHSRSADQTYEALSKFGYDMVEQAISGKLDPVIGRDDEIRRVVRVLARRTKNNPVLIGPPGVGKTAIVEGLAQRIARGDVPEGLKCKLYSLDMGALVAGASYQGQFEERLKSVLKEVQDSNGGIILFIDEIHLVLGAGQGKGAMDAANLLKPMLARGELRCIGATTLEEYRKHVEKDAAFERRFQQVYVGEPSVLDTISILRGLKEKYETHHGVRIADGALVSAANLAHRYITNRFLPDKAIDLVDEACATTRVALDSQPEIIDTLQRKHLRLEVEATALVKEKDASSQQRLQKVREELAKVDEELKPLIVRYQKEKGRLDEMRALNQKLEALKIKVIEAEQKRDVSLVADLRYYAIPELEKKIRELESTSKQDKPETEDGMFSEIIGEEDIMEVVARWTGIPVTKLSQGQSERLLALPSRLEKRVIGQSEAIEAVSEAVIRSRSGLGRANQPIGSFLFLGPTGVGKTEMAKAIAEELFDDEQHIVRIDMSEYMEKHAVSRLIGAPPGYVGYEEGGQLSEAVRRRPYNVVLLDEVEKAHPEVLDVLLQIMDDGRLTDGQGRTVDFTNTILILTSNIGHEYLTAASVTPAIREMVMNKVRLSFRPEFLNRLDDIIIFNALSQESLHRIVANQVELISKRLEGRDIKLAITSGAINTILAESYDPLYGARPLRRYLEKKIVTELSRMMLDRNLSSRLDEHSLVTIASIDEAHTGSGQASEKGNLRYIVTPLAADSMEE